MCKFCENVIDYDGDGNIKHPKVDFPKRQKLILVKESGKIRFYGFNKYNYEDDFCYQNVEVIYCPICGRDLRSEENE